VQLTKFTHACVRLEDGGRRLTIDPGVFSEVDEAVEGVDAVLITHEHVDHIDVDRVRAAAHGNSRLRVWGPASVAAALDDLGDQVVAVPPGDTFQAGGFDVRSLGGQHAVIHPSIPVIANNGYLIEGVFHPGDSLVVPPVEIDTLLLPLHAPWSNVAQVIDFAVSVRAPKVHPIHDSLLTSSGVSLVESHVARMCRPFGSEYERVEPKQTVTV